MDEEANFANLLSQSTANIPSWSTSAATGNNPSSPDPWANPFSSDPSSNPFASSTSAFGSTSAYVPAQPATQQFRLDPESPREEISPYVQKLEEDEREGRGILPDPPSVIAAREQEAAHLASGFDTFAQPSSSIDGYSATPTPTYAQRDDPFATPYSPPRSQPQPQATQPAATIAPARKLPSDLIDEDLMAASDPSISLKKAFVKSSTSSRSIAAAADSGPTDGKAKAYVFTPVKKEVEPTKHQDKKEEEPKEKEAPAASSEKANGTANAADPPTETTEQPSGEEASKDVGDQVAESIPEQELGDHAAPAKPPQAVDVETDEKPPMAPASIPLPASSLPTPIASRATTPLPPIQATAPDASQSPTTLATPSMDRVSVSPLNAPASAFDGDYGFKSLSIGAASMPSTAPIPAKTEWENKPTPSSSRFGGKGWGALDEPDVDDGGLFGKGGPSVKSDPWGGDEADGNGWGGGSMSTSASAGPSQASAPSTHSTPTRAPVALPQSEANGAPPTPSKPKPPVFSVTVGDPTRVGDPVRGYTVYTVRTRTTSPHYRKSDFSVLRRFSDFLWLFESLAMNNPGVIVPPVPDKQPFGRFQDQFIETRRNALARCLHKITSHPILQLDPDLRLFLESDSFALEAKHRRAEVPPEKSGLLSTWTGPKYIEQDEWFDSRKSYLDALEAQLRGLSKSIESASKARLELGTSFSDLAESVTALAESDLGSAMCAALARLADLNRREKEVNEDQAKSDVMHLLNLSDEYVRFIASVRLAFAGRVKAYHHWQAMEKEVVRLRTNREKLRQQGKLGDRVQSTLAEINEAERRVRDSSVDFEAISRLVKSEFARFEKTRVEEFKRVLERQLDGQIAKQKELIGAWEEYHGVVLKMVQKSQGG